MTMLATTFVTLVLLSTSYSAPPQPQNGALTQDSKLLDVLRNSEETNKQEAQELSKTKRSYNPQFFNYLQRQLSNYPQGSVSNYQGQFSNYPSAGQFPSWQPQLTYQNNQPYYIPVWGREGGQPMYFSPQPYYPNGNGGFPIDNPPKGTEYLPPNNPCKNQTYVEDRNAQPEPYPLPPVWDTFNELERNPVPTRRPGIRTTTSPPLIHNNEDVSTNNNRIPQNQGNNPNPNQNQGGGGGVGSPSVAGPSRCIWAVISCCSADTNNISYRCFEQLGCSGAFWDTNPCDTEFAQTAIEFAMNYYNTRK